MSAKDAMRILVVDDDRQVREHVRDLLAEDGYRVKTAQSGQEGLDELPGFNPDLIILDVVMPRMSGIEFIRRIKRPGSKGLSHPVLLLTSHPNLAAFLSEYAEALSIKVQPNTTNRLAKWLGFVKPTADRQELLHKVSAVLSPPRLRLLIGEPDNRLYARLRRVFAAKGYAIDRVEDGDMVVARAIETKPDAIVVNHVLPRLNGDFVAKRLREFSSTSEIPVHVYQNGDLEDEMGTRDLVEKTQRFAESRTMNKAR